MKRGYFDGPWGQVHYRRFGAGVPTILLHQSPLSSAQFDAAVPFLSQAGLDCVALDLPGMGMSDPVPSGAKLDDFVAIIPAALAHFGWSKTHFIGHHTGASLAARYAAQEPAKVDRLILNGVAFLSEQERAFFATFEFGPTQIAADGTHLVQAWTARLKATPGWSDLDAMHRYTMEGLMRGRTSWMAFPAVIGHDLTPDIMALTVPTLFFTNTTDDLYEATQRASALRPDFAYRALEGGTHDIIDEQPEAWANIVIDFLRS